MSGFLSKLGLRNAPVSTGQQWRDDSDPRIVYYLRPRARRISIKMDNAKRELSVTVPGSAGKLTRARKFVAEKRDWINVQLEDLSAAQPFVSGGNILYHGELYQLLCPGPRGRASIDHGAKIITVPAPEGSFDGRTKRFLIREAREALTMCTRVHASALGKTVSKISVRDTASRWGSCVTRNGEGHISYSWRLICAPPFVLDYVAAHECAHLIEANHGAGFWTLCDDLVDTVKPAKRWLSRNGGRLHAVGAQH